MTPPRTDWTKHITSLCAVGALAFTAATWVHNDSGYVRKDSADLSTLSAHVLALDASVQAMNATIITLNSGKELAVHDLASINASLGNHDARLNAHEDRIHLVELDQASLRGEFKALTASSCSSEDRRRGKC